MENNQQPCPCRNMSKRISHEEIERLQDKIDGAYEHQGKMLQTATETLSQMQDIFKWMARAIRQVEITNRNAIHEITGHADSNGYRFISHAGSTRLCINNLNQLHDAISFLEDCHRNNDFPIGHHNFDEAISIIGHSEYCRATTSKRMQTIMDELNKMTIKDSHKLPQLIEALTNEQAEILETFVKERMASNGK